MSITLRARHRRNTYAIPRPASSASSTRRPLLIDATETEVRAVDRTLASLFADSRRVTMRAILRGLRRTARQPPSIEQVRFALLSLHHQGILELDPELYDTYVKADRYWGDFEEIDFYEGEKGEDLEGDRIVVLCYPPFSGVNAGCGVTGHTRHWWAAGALYAFCIPHVVSYEAPVIISTRCPGCGTAISLDVEAGQPPSATACDFRELPVAHFLFSMASGVALVEWAGRQRLFCHEKCVDLWCQSVGRTKGGVMEVDTLWHLAKGWCPKNDRNSQLERQQLLEKLGLKGPFWKLRQKPEGWERYRMLR
ncbi:putative transmembrane protein [Trichosporon asahii var. asahii CBS 2479]|uniref:Putative transmembrane protein n=1 Tax=Trichosporon asahii var. asahii (strain ATCC 90039 / CBS 2479 / JCM 2466 / KCTC 7840 / NBRC 103889/ NCYC 2677 / UAMH 7654) TaxID=1186058 RepID=J8QI09_TRIAS|nr:putative transmembrane protein [Trichosporon asahii var. asahii CBS 2479]EJT53278.1 putative transmembrane protein [Trichosporon asahii var. asahii CBS 2479]